ncbi:energy transducer TonB [Parerythrobacter lacustris]|uniref:Energy transducer TonB n=1 Tax=Parerythrobacter lacustris TaxID=2969984 RepID=A0ABT1XRT4_9SPHN|nr:energy transducer TonB [Parerythrobacter lacustris]MCR2834373.1 energy transducer TonB [Parerythrobacter lacustris]
MEPVLVKLKAAVLFGTAALALSAPASVEAKIVRLAPSGPWSMNYADDSCRLSRLFGEGEERVAFYIERYGPGDRFHMVVAGEALGKSPRPETRVQFGAQDAGYDYVPSLGELVEYSPALIFTAAYPSAQRAETGFARKSGKEKYEDFIDPRIFAHDVTDQQLAAIEWVAFERTGGHRVELEMPQFGQAMKSMQTCTEELVSHWNIDVEAHRSLTKLPAPENSPGGWIRSSDYPRELLYGGYQGIVQFRLSVDTTGKATACHIQNSTRPEGFDKIVCEKIMKRARFEPALDKDGRPIASFYRNTVRFLIP